MNSVQLKGLKNFLLSQTDLYRDQPPNPQKGNARIKIQESGAEIQDNNSEHEILDSNSESVFNDL